MKNSTVFIHFLRQGCAEWLALSSDLWEVCLLHLGQHSPACALKQPAPHRPHRSYRGSLRPPEPEQQPKHVWQAATALQLHPCRAREDCPMQVARPLAPRRSCLLMSSTQLHLGLFPCWQFCFVGTVSNSDITKKIWDLLTTAPPEGLYVLVF